MIRIASGGIGARDPAAGRLAPPERLGPLPAAPGGSLFALSNAKDQGSRIGRSLEGFRPEEKATSAPTLGMWYSSREYDRSQDHRGTSRCVSMIIE